MLFAAVFFLTVIFVGFQYLTLFLILHEKNIKSCTFLGKDLRDNFHNLHNFHIIQQSHFQIWLPCYLYPYKCYFLFFRLILAHNFR
jgi:hypothetical protein